MPELPKGQPYFGSDESRFATGQDEDRMGRGSAPPSLSEESGTPQFAKGHAPAEHRASMEELSEEERELRANAESTYQGSRGLATE